MFRLPHLRGGDNGGVATAVAVAVVPGEGAIYFRGREVGGAVATPLDPLSYFDVVMIALVPWCDRTRAPVPAAKEAVSLVQKKKKKRRLYGVGVGWRWSGGGGVEDNGKNPDGKKAEKRGPGIKSALWSARERRY